MKPTGIRIVNQAEGKQIALASNTQVFVVRCDDDGNEDEIEISHLVRAADARLRVGEIVTAKLEVFLTGIETRAAIEEVVVRDLRPRKLSLWRRFRDATTFGTRERVYFR